MSVFLAVLALGSLSLAPAAPDETSSAAPAHAGPASPSESAADEYARVEIQGVLRTGIVAIGGETTGVVVAAGGVTFELDLGGTPELWSKAQGLSGSRVRVWGTLHERKGVERPRRLIVSVTRLEAAPASKK